MGQCSPIRPITRTHGRCQCSAIVPGERRHGSPEGRGDAKHPEVTCSTPTPQPALVSPYQCWQEVRVELRFDGDPAFGVGRICRSLAVESRPMASWATGAWGSAASTAADATAAQAPNAWGSATEPVAAWGTAAEPVAAWGAQPSSGFGGAPGFGFSGGDPLAAFTSANRPVSFSSFVPGAAEPAALATNPADTNPGPVSMLISPAPRPSRLVPPSSGPTTAGGKRRRAEAGADTERGDASPERDRQEGGAPTGPGLPAAPADGGAEEDGSVDDDAEAGADEGGAGDGGERGGGTPTRQHEQAFDAPTVTFEAAPGAVLANGEEGEFTVLQVGEAAVFVPRANDACHMRAASIC